jgi:hypothetical protein
VRKGQISGKKKARQRNSRYAVFKVCLRAGAPAALAKPDSPENSLFQAKTGEKQTDFEFNFG